MRLFSKYLTIPRIFLADPPWKYNNRLSGEGRTRFGAGVHDKYATLHASEIARLPVRKYFPDDCVLFMWVTMPLIYDTHTHASNDRLIQRAISTGDTSHLLKMKEPHEALTVLKGWGFNYSTNGFTWVKLTKDGTKPVYGGGSFTGSNVELCLVATKGSRMTPKWFGGRRLTPSILMVPRMEHSRKPDIHTLIDQMYPEERKVELFARRPVHNKYWTVWGNEVA